MNLLDKLLKQENTLQFTSFSSETAWELGQIFVKKGQEDNLSITIDISMNVHQLFHYSFSGTSPDNDEWVKRKIKTVMRFGHSSFYMGQHLKSKGKTIEDAYLVPESEFAAHGGCFPLIIKGSGVVGTITVSGLAQEDDHQLVIDVIGEFLQK